MTFNGEFRKGELRGMGFLERVMGLVVDRSSCGMMSFGFGIRRGLGALAGSKGLEFSDEGMASSPCWLG